MGMVIVMVMDMGMRKEMPVLIVMMGTAIVVVVAI